MANRRHGTPWDTLRRSPMANRKYGTPWDTVKKRPMANKSHGTPRDTLKDAVLRYNLDSAKIETYFEFLRHFCRATAGCKNGAKIQNKPGFWQNPNCTKKRHL